MILIGRKTCWNQKPTEKVIAKFKLTNAAVSELKGIWEYTLDKWPEMKADNYYREIIERCDCIAENPTVWRNYEGIAPTLLGIKAKKHLIFYRILENGVIENIRILHERMDLRNRLGD